MQGFNIRFLSRMNSEVSTKGLYENYWGKGLYQEALRLASQEYFLRSNCPFFQACVDVGNKRSYYALKKYGFADAGLCNGPYGKQYQLVLRKKL